MTKRQLTAVKKRELKENKCMSDAQGRTNMMTMERMILTTRVSEKCK